MNTGTEVPPIVLLVAVQGVPDGSHVAALEEAGFWVAESQSLEDALQDAVDLRPDVIVADVTRKTLERQSRELVRTLNTGSSTAGVPVVVLERAIDAPGLRDAVERAISESRGSRQLPQTLRESPKGLAPMRRVQERACPECGQPLVWVERRTVAGVEYDYYQWCTVGCGLYCFHLSMEQWLKLA